MIQELLDISQDDSMEVMRVKFGDFLGLKKEVPTNALLRALHDPVFAQNLIICRNTPGFLIPLLDDPKNEQYGVTYKNNEITNKDLVKKAGRAFLSWSKTGFTVTDRATLEKRENACLSCENIGKPEKILQTLVTTKAKDQIGKRAADSVCKLCGCVISKKIRLPSESCPAEHPELSGMNRWGEPVSA